MDSPISRRTFLPALALSVSGCRSSFDHPVMHPSPATSVVREAHCPERAITQRPTGHILTNTGVWSPDSHWIVYDVRTREEVFDGNRIEIVHVETGEVRTLYTARNGAHCGVATWHTKELAVLFILGPENPTPDWTYGPSRRQGVLVHMNQPDQAIPLDARDLVPPFTPGALRGGSHVHVVHPRGDWVSFTYDDEILLRAHADPHPTPTVTELNQRNVGVVILSRPVQVGKGHPRNHDGTGFSFLASETVDAPEPGSDQIQRAFEDAWVGVNGYVRPDGSRQNRAIAFQGEVRTRDGQTMAEVFIVDLPDAPVISGNLPIQGTDQMRPRPPLGVVQRRLTRTDQLPFPGIQGPRHWLRSSPDGAHIAFLMRDNQGIVQIWTVSPNGGAPRQVTRHPWDIASAFSWSPDGHWISFVMDNSIFVTQVGSGQSIRLTSRTPDASAPRHHACVFSPDGTKIAFMRPVAGVEGTQDQVFMIDVGALDESGRA